MSVKLKTASVPNSFGDFHSSIYRSQSALEHRNKPKTSFLDQSAVTAGSKKALYACSRHHGQSHNYARNQNTPYRLSQNSFSQVQENADYETREANMLVQSILNTEQVFIKELDGYLNYIEGRELRKKELLHKAWTVGVSEPVQDKLQKHVKIHCPSKAEENKKLFLQYLDYCNKKGHVFLEDYDPYEYNPFLLHLNHPKYFKVQIPVLNDPLFKQSHGRMEEDAAILHCITGETYTHKKPEEIQRPNLPFVSQGRHCVNSTKWIQMPQGDTDSDFRSKSSQRIKGITNSGLLNVWETTVHPASLFEEEMQVCKKRKCPNKQATVEDIQCKGTTRTVNSAS
ncbi:protein FAM228A [Erpetoichthys calabaricus]|uniref:protein FAM228A n=1 Tax=Erpetoichthys calabaricus TaxID=27687 RepID=UPI0010A03D26|nr:protein FAM228A [Erpetoichthys calabaricus]XP_051781565.1 protein FAM228A [Erpetoichthys calabaricus]